VLQAVSTLRLPMGPNMVRDANWMLRAVDDLDCAAETRLWLVMTLMAFVQGAGLLLVAERDAARKGEPGVEDWWDAREPAFGKALEAAGADALAALTGGRVVAGPPDLDAFFEFGLARTLDGIAALAAR
jgi:hypothetical protein